MAATGPQLNINRTIARARIEKLIDEWCDLRDRDLGPLSGKSSEDIQAARELFPQRLRETAAELTRIFDQDSVADEFQALPMPPLEDQSNLDVHRALAEAATQRIDWLTKLQSELDSFPESPNISRRVRPT